MVNRGEPQKFRFPGLGPLIAIGRRDHQRSFSGAVAETQSASLSRWFRPSGVANGFHAWATRSQVRYGSSVGDPVTMPAIGDATSGSYCVHRLRRVEFVRHI